MVYHVLQYGNHLIRVICNLNTMWTKINETFKMFHNMQLPIQLYRWYKITSQLFWLKDYKWLKIVWRRTMNFQYYWYRYVYHILITDTRSSNYMIGSFVHTNSFRASMTNAILGKSTKHKIMFLNGHKKLIQLIRYLSLYNIF